MWDDQKKELYWVDIEDRKLYIWNSAIQKTSFRQMNQRVTMVCLTENGLPAVAMEDGVYLVTENGLKLFGRNPETRAGSRFNDGKCDPAGRLLAGTTDMNGVRKQCGLYCYTPDHCRTLLSHVSVSNGLAFSPDRKYLYYIDTPERQVWRFRYHLESGTLSGQEVWIDGTNEDGFFDGMTIDIEGNLWVCQWGAGEISRWSGRSRKKTGVVKVPCRNVSCCVFGGEKLDRLYITGAAQGTEHGGVFYCDPGVSGLPCNRLKI